MYMRMSVECYYCAFVCVFVCYVYAVAQSLRHQHEMYIYFMYWLHENREILCKWFIIFREDERNVCSAVVCTTIAFVLFFPSFVYSSPVECGTRTVDARCGATDGESNFPVEFQQHDARTVTYNVYKVTAQRQLDALNSGPHILWAQFNFPMWMVVQFAQFSMHTQAP